MSWVTQQKYQAAILFIALFYSAFSHSSINADQWTIGDGVTLTEHQGEKVLHFQRGEINFKQQDILNGIVEFDMYTEGERAFFYVYFRETSDTQSEVMYLRTHKSNAPDTLQYAPIFQGRSAWQLYHGEKGTASATIPKHQWVKVKVEFNGSRLHVWVGDNPEPVMQNVPLTGDITPGQITLRGNIPRASQASYSAKVRNIKITPLHQSSDIPASGNRETIQTNKAQFQSAMVSQVFAAGKSAITQLPDEIATGKWSRLDAQSDGVFELLRWRAIPQGMRSWAAAASFTLDSPTQQVCALNLGFSDTLTLHLNDQPLVFANASYRYSDNRQEGLLHDQQMQVFLPLSKGPNRLLAVVADSFGGWGLQVALANCNNVEVK